MSSIWLLLVVVGAMGADAGVSCGLTGRKEDEEAVEPPPKMLVPGNTGRVATEAWSEVDVVATLDGCCVNADATEVSAKSAIDFILFCRIGSEWLLTKDWTVFCESLVKDHMVSS